MKNFCASKDTIKKVKRQLIEWEKKICKSYQHLVSRIYKELLQLNNKKQPNLKRNKRDFPDGPVIKNPPCNTGNQSLIAGGGTKIPLAIELLRPHPPTTEPMDSGGSRPQQKTGSMSHKRRSRRTHRRPQALQLRSSAAKQVEDLKRHFPKGWPAVRLKAHTIVNQLLVVAVVVQLLSHAQVFCDPTDCSPPGSSVHGISQARILEWVAISFSRGSSQARD